MSNLEEVLAHIDNVCFIGRRGSTNIGLNDSKSDIDYLIVSKNEDTTQDIMSDYIILTESSFRQALSKGNFEATEALYNEEYVSQDYVSTIRQLQELLSNDENIRVLFKANVWLMLKNQLKLYRKGINDNKFGAKIVLYYSLLKEESIMEYWMGLKKISDNVQTTYFKIRAEGLNAEQVELVNLVEAERNNKENRTQVREELNNAHQRLSKILREHGLL